MAWAITSSYTFHRDWNDIDKFEGRFDAVSYAADEEATPYDLTHRVEWAQPVAAGVNGQPLDPYQEYTAIKNMSTVPVLLYHNTISNWPNPAFSRVILPGHWVEVVDLDTNTQPRIWVDSALYSQSAECEVAQVGYQEWDEQEPDFFCDKWAVGRETQTGGLTRHHPEATPTLWDTIACAALADPGEYTLWLADVAGVAVNDYWAVGYTVDVNPNGGVFAFWNDVAWAWTVINGEPPQYGVWGFATADYYSVGGPWGGDGVIWHGPPWAQSCQPEQDENRTLYCVHGHDPSLVWAAGMSGLVVYGDHVGGFTVDITITSTDHFYGVYSADITHQWVCGGELAWWGASGGTGVVWHNTLMGWVQDTVPVGTKCLRAMWGFNQNDIWAVGDQGTIIHWDGLTWTAIPEPAELLGNYDYRGVFGCWPWAVWAVGTTQAGTHVTIFWNGVNWTIDDGPTIEGDLLGLKGVEVIP